MDYETETGTEESAEEKGKKNKGNNVITSTMGSRTRTRNKMKNIERCTNISSDDDPLTHKKEKDTRGKKHGPQGDTGGKDNIINDIEKDNLALDEDIP